MSGMGFKRLIPAIQHLASLEPWHRIVRLKKRVLNLEFHSLAKLHTPTIVCNGSEGVPEAYDLDLS